MKKCLVLFILGCYSNFLFSQVIRDHRNGGIKPVIETVKPVPASQVIFYEHANYAGNSKSFGPGDYLALVGTSGPTGELFTVDVLFRYNKLELQSPG